MVILKLFQTGAIGIFKGNIHLITDCSNSSQALKKFFILLYSRILRDIYCAGVAQSV
jgi:hypothetical protein